jgi:hypothetical protein
MNFLERFSKYLQTFPDKFFITDIQSDGRMDMTNLKAFFRSFGTLLQMCSNVQKSGGMPDFFKAEEPLSLYCSTYIRSKQQNTRSIDWHKQFEFGKYGFQLPWWLSIIHNFIAALPVNIPSFITTTTFLTLPICYKLQNAQSTVELQCAQKFQFFSSCVNCM